MTKKKSKPLRQRIVNSVGLQTGDQVAADNRRRAAKQNRKFERKLKKINSKHVEQVQQASKRAYESGFDDGNDDPGDATFAPGGRGYSEESGGTREPTISWRQNLNTAWDLIQSNPLIKRSSQIKRDYIIGPGVEPKAVDPDLQIILDAFWKDNAMGGYTSELARQWSDYGAQCVPAFVRQSDGRVRLGYIDPGLIERVIADPENARDMWAVVVKTQHNLDPWVNDTGVQVYRIIREAERVVVDAPQRFELRHKESCEWDKNDIDNVFTADQCPGCGIEMVREFPKRVIEARFKHPNSPEDAQEEDITGKLTTAEQSPRAPWEIVMLDSYGLDNYSGDCFLIRKNADSNQTLGRSDHLQVADTSDQHDTTVFALGDREQLANLVFIDVALDCEGEDVPDHAKRIRKNPPPPGGINVHNMSETWNMNSPTLNQTASVATADMQRKIVLGGLAIPDAWYGAPGGTHLATVSAQGNPTWRTFSHDQGRIQSWFVGMLEFVRDQAVIAGTYRPEPTIEKTTDEGGEPVEAEVPADTSVSLPMPEMAVKDVTGLAAALGAVVGAMGIAEDRGYTSKADGIDATAKVLAELDVRPDVDKLKDAAVNEQQGAALGMGDTDAALNQKSWFGAHGALGESITEAQFRHHDAAARKTLGGDE